MCSRPHLEVDIRLWNPQLTEEYGGHLGVVMLSRVNKPAFQIWCPIVTGGIVVLCRLEEGRHFHEIGPRSCDHEQFHCHVHDCEGGVMIDGVRVAPFIRSLANAATP